MNNSENTLRIGDALSQNRMVNATAGNLWKKVALGTTSGILLGAGATNRTKTDQEDNAYTDSETETDVPVYGEAPMAHVSDSMSFDQAFAAARAEVGPGGVFTWHGGIYGTYYETEWDAMSDEQKLAYAESVHPEVTPQYIRVNLISDAYPDVVVETEVTSMHANPSPTAASDIDAVGDDDVHIVGQGEVYGHSAVALDMTGDGDADVVVVDADDSHSLTDPDVVVFSDGMATTIGDIAEGNPPVSIIENEPQANMANPEVAPDMPDYMDDAAMQI